jgi:hypothetical protein
MQWKIEVIETSSTLSGISGISGISASIPNIDEFSSIEEDCVTLIEDEINIYH